MTIKQSCPKCGTLSSLVKNGKTKDGTQRYKCVSCKRTVILKNTVTKHLKLSPYIIKRFLGYMIDDVTLDVIARNLDINIKTAHYYRYLVFNALKSYQEKVIISGTIIIDETFVRIREKKYKLQRPDGKGIRGLSNNLLCIITVINLQGICVAKVSSRAMGVPDDYIRLLNINIGHLDLIIHDGGTHQYKFMRQFNCEKINASNDETNIYSTHLIDSLHSNIKRYLFKHSGYRLKNLQHYLNFFIYRYNQLSKSFYSNKRQLLEVKTEMIDDLYQKLIKSAKDVSYKTFLSDNGIKEILESK